MADVANNGTLSDKKIENEGHIQDYIVPQLGEKRKSSDRNSEKNEPEKKKIGFSLSKSIPSKEKSLSSPSSKINISIGKKSTAPLKISLAASKVPEPLLQNKGDKKVSKIFQDDSDDEEEMPVEAKMRMRNVGRETPTASGPNSFGKSNIGFCDRQRMIQRDLQREMDKLSDK